MCYRCAIEAAHILFITCSNCGAAVRIFSDFFRMMLLWLAACLSSMQHTASLAQW